MYVKHGADTTDAWLRQPNQVKSAILKGSVIFWMTALRESIAETLSTSTISLSEAKADGGGEKELSAFSFTRFMPILSRVYIQSHLI